jgi:uncharacterized protein (TIGR02246 family)
MKKLLLNFIAITAMVMLGITANAQNKDKAAVEKLIQNYFTTLNDGDATKLTSYFTNSAALLAQGAPTATGSDQINATFKYVFDNFSYSLKVSIGETIIQGKYAIVSSTSTGSFKIKAKNETVPADFRETFILKKEKSTWKIARYMYNQPN